MLNIKRCIGLFILISLAGKIYSVQIPVMCYHNFRPAGSRRKLMTYELRAESFAAHLAWFRSQNYKPISLAQLHNFVNGQKVQLPQKPLLLTFDDGWRSQFTVAFRLMKKHGYTGVLFLYPVVLSARGGRSYMSHDQVRQMLKAGWELGAHSYDHPLLHKINRRKNRAAELTRQFKTAKSLLEKWYGEKISAVAYPNGVFLDEFLTTVKSHYRLGFSINRGFVHQHSHPLKLPRFMVAQGYHLRILQGMLAYPTNERPHVIEPANGGVFKGKYSVVFSEALPRGYGLLMQLNGSRWYHGKSADQKIFRFYPAKKAWRGMNNMSFRIQRGGRTVAAMASTFEKK